MSSVIFIIGMIVHSFMLHFSIFGHLRPPWGQNSGRSKSLTSLQIMFNLRSPQILNLNHQKLTCFHHYVPWMKIPDDMNKSYDCILEHECVVNILLFLCVVSLFSTFCVCCKQTRTNYVVSARPKQKEKCIQSNLVLLHHLP